MSAYQTRYYIFSGEKVWEDQLRRAGTSYIHRGLLYTQKQLENLSSSWGVCYNINSFHYYKEQLENTLSLMGSGQESTCIISGTPFTRGQIEKLLGIKPITPGPVPAPNPAAPATSLLDVTAISNTLNALEKRWDGVLESPSDDNHSEITQTTLSTGGMDTPRALEGEDEEEDELTIKILANLQAKMQAVKRCKKLEVEVENLRKLLAEKEADLVECQRIVALEAGQVEA